MAITQEDLQIAVDKGLSSRKIASEFSVSQSTIKYYLKKYGISTLYTRRTSEVAATGMKVCGKCKQRKSVSEFTLKKGTDSPVSYCKACHVDIATEKRKTIKRKAIAYKGGKCECCGYRGCEAVFDFHHLNPDEKDFAIAHRGHARSWEDVKVELDKCIMVCANCHREIHAGYKVV